MAFYFPRIFIDEVEDILKLTNQRPKQEGSNQHQAYTENLLTQV